MSKYIDAEKLIAEIERLQKFNNSMSSSAINSNMRNFYDGCEDCCKRLLSFITSFHQEQPMPNSTQLIELWHKDKEMLKENDFRDDPWRLACNAFLCGFGRGLMVKQKQPEVDLEKEVKSYIKDNFTITDEAAQIPEEDRMYSWGEDDMVAFAHHFYELGLKVRKEE